MKYSIIIVSIFLSAMAQVLIKKSSLFQSFSFQWIVYMALAVVAYGCSFLAYSYILKLIPLSVASPIMSIATMMVVLVCSVCLFSEVLTIKKIAGIGLGMVAILLMLSK